MAQTCRPAKCIEAIRVALLGECCTAPVAGPLNGYAMGCIIDADWSPEIEEGDESILKSDCGDICAQDIRCDITKNWNVEFKIKGPDPEFLKLISGDNLIVNGATSVGVQHFSAHCSPNLFLELFERTDDCVSGAPRYFRHVFPCVRLAWTGNEREGTFRILQISGKSKSVLVSSILDGPFNDIPAYAIAAPASTRTDYLWFEDTTLPTLQCGAIAVPAEIPVFSVTDIQYNHLSPSVNNPAYPHVYDTNLVITGTGLNLVTNMFFHFSSLNDFGFPNTNQRVISQTATQIVLEADNFAGLANRGTLLSIDFTAGSVYNITAGLPEVPPPSFT